ncbi:serine/threonine protein kinase [Microbacterium sp. NIBRBAC000506063]|nr:serine/threonine protein kinase [Microbacterium sp. NIBRBAC000506063]
MGTGGFADVFLYEQEMPRRKVAVKVLLADRITTASAQEFADEANVMAMLSTHPAIVTIYQAGVAGDGRPYLVMEYCPRPNLQVRSRKEPFSVAEALRVGVQVAGAVETAHRGGILHRDIKPANILVTEYNRPALTDFGIASTTGAVSEAAGMSIPWSPPESFADPPTSGTRSDVYALGATVYTLLSGRSPFERPGERNTSADLIERIERAPIPQLGRADSPPSLQAVLERAMAKNPDDRYPSAVAFARALQKVQIELAHSVTPIDIVDEHPEIHDDGDDGDGLTRVREVVSITPDEGHTRPSATTERKGPAPSPTGPAFASPPTAEDVVEQTIRRDARSSVPAAPAEDRTILRGPHVVAPDAATAPPSAPAPAAPAASVPAHSGRRTLWAVLGIAAGVVVIGAVILVANLLGEAPAPQASPSATERPQEVVADAVPRVSEPIGIRSGDEVTFTWENPRPEEGDSYIVQVVELSGLGEVERVTEPTVTVPAAGGQTCIDVILRRDDGRASGEVRGCLDE